MDARLIVCADTFPFQFQLPHGMPGCFDVKSCQGMGHSRHAERDHAYIQYRIKSECDVQVSPRPRHSSPTTTPPTVSMRETTEQPVDMRMRMWVGVLVCSLYGYRGSSIATSSIPST